MNHMTSIDMSDRYMRCIDNSKRVRWEIEKDVIKGRSFSAGQKFLPDGLSMLADADFLTDGQRLVLSQIQGRTYANMFGLVERFINAKILELSADHALTDQVALEALVRFSDEELKHQALFDRVDELCADVMVEGYSFDWNPNDVAGIVLSKGTWSVLLLTLHIELFTQSHYRDSIDNDASVSELYKDVFKYHWMEESQHAIIDELELRRVHAGTSAMDVEKGVDEFIELVVAVDSILQAQAKADADYFAQIFDGQIMADDMKSVEMVLLRAYRYQYIFSGANHHHFQQVISELMTDAQLMKITTALSTLN